MQTTALLFFTLFSCIVCSSNVDALSPEYEAAFQRGLQRIYDQHPRYKLGGNLEDGEIDCSELMRQAAILGRIPGISKKRLQAWQIGRGYGGFANLPVKAWARGDNKSGDLLLAHVKNGLERPDDVNHILAVVEWNGIRQVIHASSSQKKIVVIPFADWIDQSLIPGGYRRMTAGD
jgi:hypothetical protein